MSKDKDTKETRTYHKLIRDGQHFCVETITVEGNKIIKTEKTDATFLPIAFDIMRKRTIMEHYGLNPSKEVVKDMKGTKEE